MKWLLQHGWLRLGLGPALCMAVVLSASGQGNFIYQRFYTSNPDPNFPWDYEGQRVLSLYPASMTVDLNQDGVNDFVIATGGAQSTRGFYIYGQQTENKVWGYAPFDSEFVVALSHGENIGSDTNPIFHWYGPTHYSGGDVSGPVFSVSVGELTAGMYTGLASAYCGLQMQVNGQKHYGWVRVGCPIGLNGGWVYDAVFNTVPDQPLFAGQGAIPEPSTAALLALASLPFFIWRKRK